jgi:hypothetical protein
MKTSRISLLIALLVIVSVAAFANPINDPKIIIHGVQGSGGFASCPISGCTGVGLTFTFTSPEKGSGPLFFTNVSGKNWTSLTLIEKGVPAADVTCAQALFLSCTVKTLKDGSTEILLSGVHHKGQLNPLNGIPAGSSFVIDFACVQGNCWPKGGIDFQAHAGVAPEPGTMALLATGIGAIVSRRKSWKNRWNS